MNGLEPFRKPDFTNFCETLFGRPTAKIPLIELGIDNGIKAAILNRPCQFLSDEIEFMHRMGYDYVKLQPGIIFNLALPRTGRGKDQLNDKTAVRTWAEGKSGLIQSWDDFEQFDWPHKDEIDFSRLEAVKEILPEGMGVIGQYGDIFTLTWELMGFETFATAVYEMEDLVEAILNRIADLVLYMFEAMAEMDWVGVLWYSDDIAYGSGPMISPIILRKYFFPYLSHIGELSQRRNIPLIYHSDGVLWPLMEDIVACAVNALHPIEPKSMDIIEVGERYHNKLCLCGGIDVDLLSRGSIEAVVKTVKSFKYDLSGKYSWCAGSSNSIPDYVRIDNYLAMNRVLLED